MGKKVKTLDELLNILDGELVEQCINNIRKNPGAFAIGLQDGPLGEYIEYDEIRNNEEFWKGFVMGWLALETWLDSKAKILLSSAASTSSSTIH